jgi:GH25 family lysozyme M1 (1,4-beta-N-acetylmuramidase)
MKTSIWGNSYDGHQYTDDGHVDGINGNVDLNNFFDGILSVK